MIDKRAYLFRKQKGKEHMSTYIAELNAILDLSKGGYVVKDIDETDTIIQSSRENIPTTPIKKVLERFELKYGLLTDILTQSNNLLSGEAYLWTCYSSDCGIARIDSIMMVNPAFVFEAEHAGLITIFSGNLRNKLLLDFYEEGGDNFIEVEVFGNEWGGLR